MGEKQQVWFLMWAAVIYVFIGFALVYRFLSRFDAAGFNWTQLTAGGIWQYIFTWPFNISILNGN